MRSPGWEGIIVHDISFQILIVDIFMGFSRVECRYGETFFELKEGTTNADHDSLHDRPPYTK